MVERRAFTPHALGAPLRGLRYLFVGLCQLGALFETGLPLGAQVDHLLYDSSHAATIPPLQLAGYDAAVVALTLRTLLNAARPDAPDLLFARGFADDAQAQAVFDRCVSQVEAQLVRLRAGLGDLPVFVLTFLEPSFDYMGRLCSAQGLHDPAVFVRRLNAEMARRLAAQPGMFRFDLGAAFDTVGRLHLQDDVTADFSHSCIIGPDDGLDEGRLVASPSNHHVFDVVTAQPLLRSFVFRELADAVKTLRGDGRVKLVIVDLDDTLWRGVAADTQMEGWRRTEGWPLGFAEALLYFKRRGGLLAICSKNDEASTRERFAGIWGARLTLDDFACVRIGWDPKPQAIAEILAQTNPLPEQALFIDDNPRELAEVAAAFPALRRLGGSHRDWRRILLRSPETQVERVTDEGRRRTELVRGAAARQPPGPAPDRETWLRGLHLAAVIFPVEGEADPAFARALELINKTNQFNTTGRRWTGPELVGFLRKGGRMLALSLKDRLLDNGLVGLALVRPGEVVQFVLSCRVFGLGAEQALGAAAVGVALRGQACVSGRLVDTGRNLACQTFFASLGFSPDGDDWRTAVAPPPPEAIDMTLDRRLAG